MTNLITQKDRHNILPEVSCSRRSFITRALAAGFALAVRPLAGQSVLITDEQGLTAGAVTIHTKDLEIPAYRSQPRGNGRYPILLVVQEIFGVHEHIKDITRRLAKLGYLAIAPELFVRQGDVSRMSDIDDIIKNVVSRVPDAQVLADLDATMAWASEHGGDPDRLGITGFCWGGRIVWLYAAHQPRLKAGVAWYGRLIGPTSDLQPEHPLDVVNDLKAPVLGLYGGQDLGIPVESVDRMRAAVESVHGQSVIHLYPDAGHAFFADYRPSYNKEAADDGWKRALAWFRQYGV